MKCTTLVVILLFGASNAFAQEREGSVTVSFGQRIGPMEIDRMSLGQGGLSDEPMWENRIPEVRRCGRV